MGELALVRVDSRVVHGVICVTWTPTVGANRIVAVDNVTAQNAFLKKGRSHEKA